jgi:hypothetical protein
MSMRFACAALAVLFAACQSANATPAPSYRLIDLTRDYADFYDHTQGMDDAARVAAFKTRFEPLFPGFYDIARQPWTTQARYDQRIALSFAQFSSMRGRYTRTAVSFTSMLRPALDSFTEAFPDMGPVGDIYLVNSLGEMDGGVREINARYYFVFGADMMASIHTWTNERPFFQHELFHIYHRQFFAGCEQLWCHIWMEGLAVDAALTLNPHASDDELLLNLPQPIRQAVDQNLQEAVCAVRARLDSTSQDDAGKLLSFARFNERLPPRFGYYVGYLIARQAARGRSLTAIAHLDVNAARPVMEEALAQLATCPPSAGTAN